MNETRTDNTTGTSLNDWQILFPETRSQLSFPLRTWLEFHMDLQKTTTLKKLTIAFAIGKLLHHLKDSILSYSREELLHLCCVDNFSVSFPGPTGEQDWDVLVGVDMIAPLLSLQVIVKSFDGSEVRRGGIEAIITRHSPFCCAKAACRDGTSDNYICYALGTLLHFIFLGGESTVGDDTDALSLPENTQTQSPMDDFSRQIQDNHSSMNDFLRSLSISPSAMGMNNGSSLSETTCAETSRPAKCSRVPMNTHESIASQIVPGQVYRVLRDLLDCQNALDIYSSVSAYQSLDAAIEDIHTLLLNPARFVFQDANQWLSPITTMYGRSSEAERILNAYCRVASSGRSEAFIIRGPSGSGKTTLAKASLPDSMISTNRGLWTHKKFEENSTNQLSLVLAAFNDLCKSLAYNASITKQGTAHIWNELLSEFGPHIQMLANILPNVVSLAPSPAAAFSLAECIKDGGDVNFFSLCDTIKRFMKAMYSATSHSVILFLDDIQWSDPVSLGLVHTVLSDKSGESCMFFIGSYRDNEVPEDHIVHGFLGWLSNFAVPVNSVELGGLLEHDVNLLISESLGMLPRRCQSLSQIVFRKTDGIPFFVQTFLQSLVDNGLLAYSPSKRSWVWDDEEISVENITPNVLDLLSAKMANLTQNIQASLKVASCFGIKVDASIIQDLIRISKYSTLQEDLYKACQEGLMELDKDKSSFRFVHDKMREAAYKMIHCDSRKEMHFDIGMALFAGFENGNGKKDDNLFVLLDQLNHGVPMLLQTESERISIAKLYHEAASTMLQSYNYTSAFQRSMTAVSLLPVDSWSTHYDLNLQYYSLLSQAAYSQRKIEVAKDAVHKIVEHATSLQTKIDAYALLQQLLLAMCVPKEMDKLLVTIVGVLKELGENILLDNVTSELILSQVHSTKELLESLSNDELSHKYMLDSEDHSAIMRAYSTLMYLSWIAKPKLWPYFVVRWAQYCLKHKVACDITPVVYVAFAAVLCQDIGSADIMIGKRIGKLGMQLFDQYNSPTREVPALYMLYYTHCGILFEPIQACIDMHQRAIDIGLQVGNPSYVAIHKQFLLVRKFHAGTNLLDLKEEFDCEIKSAEHHCSFPMLSVKLRLYYEAVLTLIGEDSSNDIDLDDELVYDREQAYVFSRLISLVYLGYYERARRMVERWKHLSGENVSKGMVSFRWIMASFYYGLSDIAIRRQRNVKSRKIPEKEWLDVVKDAAKCSEWNYQNKASLLLAEKFSSSRKYLAAEEHYTKAIEESRSSRFVHEEGLASELAGMHYVRQGNMAKACELFRQAESCYEAWGSAAKICQVQEKIKSLWGKHPPRSFSS